MKFAVVFTIAVLCRALDMVSTWLVSPDMKYEANPIVRWLGWKRWAIANLWLCLCAALVQGFPFYFICAYSIVLFLWNMRYFI